MKIELGKYYKTRDGRKVGPAEAVGDDDFYPFNVPHEGRFYGYTADGKSCLDSHKDDIVSEWLTVEAGRYYIDGHGEKHGPMKAEHSYFVDARGWGFYANGQRMAKSDDPRHPDHIVSEWVETADKGPVRTVMRREIVPGVYGRVIVRDIICDRVIVRLDKDKGDNANLISMTAQELRSAAMVLSQLAEALDDA